MKLPHLIHFLVVKSYYTKELKTTVALLLFAFSFQV